jgi:uncharacterized membrane protein YfcA
VTPAELALLAPLVLAIAALYASVGHGGASGYLAAMALLGVAPAFMRPTALALNILVAGLATYHFARAGFFSWRLFLPFAATSIPLAAVGGALALPDPVYKRLVGAALLLAALHLFRTAARAPEPGVRPPRWWAALAVGAGLGLLSGLTGVGGGIFLSPLLLMAGWAGVRETAATSAAFILVNSVAGLAGFAAAGGALPGTEIAVLAATAVAGGWAGARLGSRRLARPTIRRLLALVLLLAGIKFLFLL